MKNVSLILNAILAIAVVILFVLVLGNKSTIENKQVISGNDTVRGGKLPIAYINIDSLLLNYTLAKESNESLIKKQEESRLTNNSNARTLQT